MLSLFAAIVRFLVYFGILSFAVGTVFYFTNRDRPLLDHSLSHWYQTIPHLNGTPFAFYQRVMDVIREQRMPNVEARTVTYREGGILSDKRDYLRVVRQGYVFDLCVAPFGTTLFISSWLCEDPHDFFRFLANIPVFGWLFKIGRLLFDPETYYTIDAALMFQGAVHTCVLQVLDEMTKAQGIDPIPEIDRKPVLREVYGGRKQRR